MAAPPATKNTISVARRVLGGAALCAVMFAVFAVIETWGALTWRTIGLSAAVGAAFGVEIQALLFLFRRSGLPEPSLVREVGGQPRANWRGIALAYAWVIPIGALWAAHLAIVFGWRSQAIRTEVTVMLLMPLIYHMSAVSVWKRQRGQDLERRRAELAADRERIIAEARAR